MKEKKLPKNPKNPNSQPPKKPSAAVKKEELRQILLTAFTDEKARGFAAQNGLHTAKKYHESKAAGLQLKNILEM